MMMFLSCRYHYHKNRKQQEWQRPSSFSSQYHFETMNTCTSSQGLQKRCSWLWQSALLDLLWELKVATRETCCLLLRNNTGKLKIIVHICLNILLELAGVVCVES